MCGWLNRLAQSYRMYLQPRSRLFRCVQEQYLKPLNVRWEPLVLPNLLTLCTEENNDAEWGNDLP